MKLKLNRLPRRLAPNDPVDRALKLEDKAHLGDAPFGDFGASDQIIIALDAALAEQYPRDGIKQRALARAVGAGDAGQMNATKVRLNRIAVREKVAQAKLNGNRWEISSRLSSARAPAVGAWMSRTSSASVREFINLTIIVVLAVPIQPQQLIRPKGFNGNQPADSGGVAADAVLDDTQIKRAGEMFANGFFIQQRVEVRAGTQVASDKWHPRFVPDLVAGSSADP